MAEITVYRNPSGATSRNVLSIVRNSGAEPRVAEHLKIPPSQGRNRPHQAPYMALANWRR